MISEISDVGSTASPYCCEISRTRSSAARSSRMKPSLDGSIPSTMFSATVITGMSMKCWWTIPIPAPIASLAEWNVTDLPWRRISPESGL